MMTNTWDTAVYGLVLLVLAIQILMDDPYQLKKLLSSALVTLLTMSVVALPWWLSFHSISNGVKMVTEMSPFWQLLVLWGGGLIISSIAFLVEGKGEQKFAIRTLVVAAVLLIIIPEVVYAKDIYPNHPRANTMFKLTYQAFIMMGILLGATVGKLLDGERTIKLGRRVLALIVVSLIFLGTMIFPFKAFPTYYNSFKNYQGLDGENWMVTRFPETYGAVKYLENNRNGKNMVEAVGDSYTLMNSVSVFSGVPTIQGWRVHEWLWRGGYDVVASRETEVRDVYQSEDGIKTQTILKKYNVGWILVGQEEKMAYKINEEKLWQLGKIVWQQGDTYLIKVN